MDPKEQKIFSLLEKTGKLTGPLIQQFRDNYGDLFFKALEYIQVDTHKVVKNIFQPSELIIWSVQGVEQTYVVYPEIYCQCQSFQMDAIYRNRKFKMCKHLLAQKLAESLNLFEIIERKDSTFKEFSKQIQAMIIEKNKKS